MANITRYNAKDCTVTVGNVIITGLGEDMVSFGKEEAYFENVVGAQGDIVKSEINNDIHTLTITVQPTCPQLPFLLGLLNSKENTSVWVINKSLGMRFGGSQAAIQEMPEVALGAEAEDMEFTFTVFDGVLEAAK